MSGLKATRFGPYEIAALIGVGGMGEVYRASDTNLKRDVALKVLPDSFVTDTMRLARLQREAELLAALNHTNVAQIYGLERSDGRSALVMELVEGPTLAERIAQGPLLPNDALDVARQIAAALEAAHERGIVHRDLKPANVKVKLDGTVKVLDFGIAKALDARAASGGPPALVTPTMTEAGLLLGTAAYMAPEQARGKPVDRRADIWAFGCVLFEMLTGKAAFLGDDVTDTLARVLEREPDLNALPSGLAPAVRGTLELCLQKNPKDRLRDIGDVTLALDGRLAPVAGATAARAHPKHHVLAVAGGLVLGMLAASVYFASRTPPLAADRATLPVTRFTINVPASAPLADLGGYDVAISPDGRRLAYFAHNLATGNIALYVRDLDGLEARLVPGTEVSSAGTSGTMNPFFSADGQSIGFLAPDRGVVRVPLDGGPAQKIVDSPSPAFLGATWTDDDSVIYSSGSSLHRVSGRGGTPQRLTGDFANGVVAGPTSLPGGRAVLIDRIEEGMVRVAALDLSTGEQKIVVEGGQGPTYAPTGHVVFARGTALMAVPFDARTLAVTGEPVTVLEGVRHSSSASAPDYALSASGTLVYIPSASDVETRAAVVWVDRTGQAVGRAVNELLQNPRDPALSPDGTRLLLTTGPPSDGDVWSYDLRGRPPIRLAATGDAHHAVWSPDSRRIAFTVLNVPSADLYELAADGTMLTPRLVRSLWLSRVFAWSATDELFLVGFAGADIEVMPVTGETEPRGLVATDYGEFDPALSPNGRWLAYASNRTGRNEVWVQGYPDGAVVRISTNGGYEPRWSADGRELYYLEPSGRGASMMAVTVQTADEFSFDTPAELFEMPYFADEATMVGSYDVARDGRFVMIELVEGAGRGTRSANIIVVQNWTEELKRRVTAE